MPEYLNSVLVFASMHVLLPYLFTTNYFFYTLKVILVIWNLPLFAIIAKTCVQGVGSTGINLRKSLKSDPTNH